MLTFIQNGTASYKHTLIEFETFGSYFISHSEHLYKIFILLCVTVTVSDKVI